jgi:hypothetical protein
MYFAERFINLRSLRKHDRILQASGDVVIGLSYRKNILGISIVSTVLFPSHKPTNRQIKNMTVANRP